MRRGFEIHRVLQVLVEVERAWSTDSTQANARALIVANALASTGYLPDAEVHNGMVVYRENADV